MTELIARIQTALHDGDPARAAVLASDYLAIEPSDPYILLLYSESLRELGRFDDSERAARSALLSLPSGNEIMAYRELGHTANQRRDLTSAVTWYGKVIELRPYDAGGYIYLGAAYALAGQLDEAESWHRKGIECPIGATEEACLNLGLVLRARGKTVDAARYFRKALKIDPEYNEAREALVQLAVADRQNETLEP